jgi:hypothetical protein
MVRLSGFGLSRRPTPNAFVNARFSRGIWPSGVGRQDSRNCYFIYVGTGAETGVYAFVPVKRSGTFAGTSSIAH